MIGIINDTWEKGILSIADKSVDCVLTDPPYGMGFRSNHRKVRYGNIEGDNDLSWVQSWVKQISRVVKDDAHLYVFCSFHNVDIFKQALEAVFTVKNILIWEKNNTSMGDLEGDYAPQYEMIIFCSNGKRKLNGGRDSNILKAKRTGNILHPTQKPVTLLSYLIEKSTSKGDLVLDTFAGSFATGKACAMTGRNFIGFEIIKSFCDVATRDICGVTPMLFSTME